MTDHARRTHTSVSAHAHLSEGSHPEGKGREVDQEVDQEVELLPRALRALASENPYRTNRPPSRTQPRFLTTDRARASAGCRVHAKDEAKTTTWCAHGRPGALYCSDCMLVVDRATLDRIVEIRRAAREAS